MLKMKPESFEIIKPSLKHACAVGVGWGGLTKMSSEFNNKGLYKTELIYLTK